MDHDVPFISNTPDDKQCLPAAYGMVRQYFEPELEIVWDDWMEMVGSLPGKGAWSTAGLVWFNDNGYDVVHIGTFDFQAFIDRGDQYLVEALGEEVTKWRLQYWDIKLEQARARRFLQSNVWINREADLFDVRQYLDEGYLVKCLVNLNALNDKPGYIGHAVIVKGYTDTHIILHDPGLPARPNRQVDNEHFLKAWIDPEAKSEKMDAIRKRPTVQEVDTGLKIPLAETIANEPLIAA